MVIDVVSVRVLCCNIKVEGVKSWQRKGIRCGCGDVRRNFDVVAEGCRVLPELGFVSGVEVLDVVVASGQVISGTGCAVLAWRYDLSGNSQEGGKQRQKQLQMEPVAYRGKGVFLSEQTRTKQNSKQTPIG